MLLFGRYSMAIYLSLVMMLTLLSTNVPTTANAKKFKTLESCKESLEVVDYILKGQEEMLETFEVYRHKYEELQQINEEMRKTLDERKRNSTIRSRKLQYQLKRIKMKSDELDQLKSNLKKLENKIIKVRTKRYKHECPIGWKMFETTCYVTFHGPMNYSRANEVCEGNGGEIAEVRRNGLAKFINEKITDTYKTAYWTTLRKQNGKWKWPDGTLLSENRWRNTQPDGGDCVVFNHLKSGIQWDDVPCDIDQLGEDLFAVVCVRTPFDRRNS